MFMSVDTAVSRRLISLEMFSLTTQSGHPPRRRAVLQHVAETLQIANNKSARLDQALAEAKTIVKNKMKWNDLSHLGNFP